MTLCQAALPLPMPSSIATASQAWAILVRHARDDIQNLRLQELCKDNDRVSSLVAVHASDKGTLIIDLSRQRMTLDTLQHLLHLANARGCLPFIHDLVSNPHSLHLALRAPKGSTLLTPDGTNGSAGIHLEWERLERISESIRRGNLRGVTGAVIRDVVVVGCGVPTRALEFVYRALLHDAAGYAASKEHLAELLTRRTFTTSAIPVKHRRLRIVKSVDGLAAQEALADLEAASTVVISLALTGHEETGLASRLLKNWLLQQLGQSQRKTELIFSKHMLLVTGNDRIIKSSKPESVFFIPPAVRSEPFCTLSSMTLLPLSIIFGWRLANEMLQGAHDLDSHVVESNPRHNLPLLLALTDLWNDAFLQTPGRLIEPFCSAFSEYGSYVAALEAQVCGDASEAAFLCSSATSCGYVVTKSDYDRSLYQASRILPTELAMVLDPPQLTNRSPLELTGLQQDLLTHHDTLMCSLFAHADELALGAEGGVDQNRPSTLLLCGKLNAYMCGQFIALAEHRASLKAILWNMNPFPTQVGASIRTTRTDRIKQDLKGFMEKGEDEELEVLEGSNLSTTTLLTNYVSRTRELRAMVNK